MSAQRGSSSSSSPKSELHTSSEAAGVWTAANFSGTDELELAVRLTIEATPYIEPSDVSIRSLQEPVLSGASVEAGSPLSVVLVPKDCERLAIDRRGLGLRVALSIDRPGTEAQSIPMKYGLGGAYTAELPGTWLREPGDTLQSAPCALPRDPSACFRFALLHRNLCRAGRRWTVLGELEVVAEGADDSKYTMLFKTVKPSKSSTVVGAIAAALAGLALLASIFLFYRYGTKAKAIIANLLTNEGLVVFSLGSELFDISGDAAVFKAIYADSKDPEFRAAVKGLITAAWVFFTMAVLISLCALVAKAKVLVRLFRSRRESGLGGVQRRSYFDSLKDKIMQAENQLTQTYWGCALAVLEDVPLGSIGIRFLVAKCVPSEPPPAVARCWFCVSRWPTCPQVQDLGVRARLDLVLWHHDGDEGLEGGRAALLVGQDRQVEGQPPDRGRGGRDGHTRTRGQHQHERGRVAAAVRTARGDLRGQC